MALITPAADPSPDGSTAQYAPQIADLIAGEDILACAPCRIDGSTGMVYMSNGTAANANAGVDGVSARSAKTGQPITLFGHGTRFRYANKTLTPGQRLYVAATAGRLDDTATTGDAVGVAKAITDSDIRVIRDN